MGILLPLCYYQHSAGGTTNIAAVTINIPVMLVVNVASNVASYSEMLVVASGVCS